MAPPIRAGSRSGKEARPESSAPSLIVAPPVRAGDFRIIATSFTEVALNYRPFETPGVSGPG
jgi:hypothetical protein